jgi:hypothetical protein
MVGKTYSGKQRLELINAWGSTNLGFLRSAMPSPVTGRRRNFEHSAPFALAVNRLHGCKKVLSTNERIFQSLFYLKKR